MSWIPGSDMLDSFLHPERGYQEGEKAINNSWQEASGYMRPYQQAGTNEIGRLHDATGQLLDPQTLLNKWMSGYEASPYAKDTLARSQGIGMDAASSMGLSGSSAALENNQRTGSSIMNADRSNYLQDLMQKYMAGVQSSQNIFGTGAGVGNAMGQGALQTGENVAQMKYGAENAPGNLFGGLLGTAASAAGTYMTGMPMNFGNMSGNTNMGGSSQYKPWQPGGAR